MTKSIQDYRNIVKILKLQLLKVREQNSSISHQLGIISENQNSSFTPKIQKYKQSKDSLINSILPVLQFAHRCQLVGVTPQMVFRIADKQRDKQIKKKGFTQIMKRIKLRFDDQQIQKILALLVKQDPLNYQDYLQRLSAYQINSQKYPQNSTRTFSQLSLIKLCNGLKSQYSSSQQIYNSINGNKSNFKFVDFNIFLSKTKVQLKQTQVLAIFMALDLHNQCKIQKSIFQRQIDKIYQLISKGVVDDRPQKQNKLTKQIKQSKQTNKINNNNKKQMKRTDSDDQQFQQTTTIGDQKFKQKVKQKKQIKVKKQFKLDKGNVKDIQKQLSKGLSVSQLIQQILKNQRKDIIPRSFSLGDILNAIKQVNTQFPKKDVMNIFKLLDKDRNGCISTQELIKLWVRSQQIKKANANHQILLKLLYRHFKQIQYPEPAMKFINLGYKPADKINTKNMQDVFQKLQLSKQQIQYIIQLVADGTIQQFSDKLKSQGKPKISKKFEKMKQSDYKLLSSIIKKMSIKKEQSRFKKLIRPQQDEQQQQNPQQQYWNTIFTDPWACYQYCINTAYKLDNFWRDPEFGPTANQKSGIRSIIGNESMSFPAIPAQDSIQWFTYQQLLALKGDTKTKVKFMKQNLISTDVVQGRLGNCWYVSALSIIANNDQYIKGKSLQQCKNNSQYLLQGIHPPLFHFFVNYGIYVFKYFKKFKPVYVIVDNLFPVDTGNNELIFAKCPQLDHQWVSFAQKSYAKLHHAYTNMVSGDIAQGLNDLTNTLPIKQSLNQQTTKLQDEQFIQKSQQLKKIRKLTQQRQLMGCSISAQKGGNVQKPVELDGQKCGLFYGHAYSIIDYLDLNTRQKLFNLIRVRNPWGHSEWMLDWSDKPIDTDDTYKKLDTYKSDLDKHYKQKQKDAQKNKIQPIPPYKPGDDGQFLMNFKDWLSLFTNLFTGLTIKNYKGKYIKQIWDENNAPILLKPKKATQKQKTQFIQKNHQYILQVQKDDTDILMILIQQDGRLYRGQKYPYKQIVNAAMIMIFKLQGKSAITKFQKSDMMFDDMKLQVRRDITSWHKFKKGKYAIIPCKSANQIMKSQFQFKIYSDQKIKIQKYKSKDNNFKQIQQIKTKWDNSVVNEIINYLNTNNPKYTSIDAKKK